MNYFLITSKKNSLLKSLNILNLLGILSLIAFPNFSYGGRWIISGTEINKIRKDLDLSKKRLESRCKEVDLTLKEDKGQVKKRRTFYSSKHSMLPLGYTMGQLHDSSTTTLVNAYKKVRKSCLFFGFSNCGNKLPDDPDDIEKALDRDSTHSIKSICVNNIKTSVDGYFGTVNWRAMEAECRIYGEKYANWDNYVDAFTDRCHRAQDCLQAFEDHKLNKKTVQDLNAEFGRPLISITPPSFRESSIEYIGEECTEENLSQMAESKSWMSKGLDWVQSLIN